jgi:hypothetical protein
MCKTVSYIKHILEPWLISEEYIVTVHQHIILTYIILINLLPKLKVGKHENPYYVPWQGDEALINKLRNTQRSN